MTRKTDVLLSAGVVAMVATILAGLALAGRLDEFGAWAWDRHHNILSWYVRPLLLLPYAWFAYRRSLLGMTLSLVALATSMFWFPAPANPTPAQIEILQLERAYLSGPWTLAKILIALLVPATFAGLAIALWRRSLTWGLGVINAMVLIKVAWTFVFTPGQGAVLHLIPALGGLAVVDAVILAAARHLRTGHDRAPRATDAAARG
jgi:hypothetical protein